MLSADILSAVVSEPTTVATSRHSLFSHNVAELHSQTHKLTLQLCWASNVDLDLHAFYRSKTGRFGHVYFGKKGNIKQPPYMQLREDAGVLQMHGHKIEQLTVYNLAYFDYLLIACNAFKLLGFSDRQSNFADYSSVLKIDSDKGDSLLMPLNAAETGNWCVIAKLDNTLLSAPKLLCLNRVQKQEPTLNDFINID